MNLVHISIGNLKRRKAKAFLLVAGLSIGVAMVVAMFGITHRMQADVERKLDEYGANIIIVPKAENLSLAYGGVSVTDASYDVEELGEKDAEMIKTIKDSRNVSAVAPKLIGAHKIRDLSYLIVGVDFPSELRIKRWWQLSGRDPEGAYDIVLGKRASETLRIQTGESLMIDNTNYKVAAVLEENASQDDIALFMDIREARRLLNKDGKTSMIEVSALCSECPIEDIVAQISEKLPHAKVTPVRQAMTLRMQTVDQIMKFSIAVSIVVLVIGAFIVFISMLSAVSERTKEIGVLRAIGYRKSHILKTILIEAFIVSICAGLIGWLGGSLSASLLAPTDIAYTGIGFDMLTFTIATSIALMIGMLSSVYPAVKASKLEPSEALRYF